jgi:hypothetical protein
LSRRQPQEPNKLSHKTKTQAADSHSPLAPSKEM